MKSDAEEWQEELAKGKTAGFTVGRFGRGPERRRSMEEAEVWCLLRREKTAGRECFGAGGGFQERTFRYVEFQMPITHTRRDVEEVVCQKGEFEPNVTLVWRLHILYPLE